MTDIARTAIPSHPSDVASIDLVNSTFTDHLGTGESVDRIAERRWQNWFLQWHGLEPRPAGVPPLEDLRALRRDVRRILEKWATDKSLTPRDARALDRRIRDVALRRRVSVTEQGLEFQEGPLRGDWDWVVAAITASAVELITTGEAHRLKVCANPACSWMFYDETINRSKQYCSTSPCASLLRVRKFRQRE